MNVAIKDESRRIEISGGFSFWLIRASSDKACLSFNQSGTDYLWINEGDWPAKKEDEEGIEEFKGNGRCEVRLICCGADRALLWLVGANKGKPFEKVIWLSKKEGNGK